MRRYYQKGSKVCSFRSHSTMV